MVVYHYRSLSQSDSEGSVSSGETLHAQPAPVKCRWESCGEWFSQLELLAGHVTTKHAVPGKGGLFYCHWESCNRANRGFNARYKMLVHMRTHTNEKPHHCFQCDKSFSRAENLKIHARSHTGERPYVCPVAGCGKAYSNSSDRFKHTRTHSVDKPYVCKVAGCPKRYTDPSSLRKHVKTYRHYPNSNLKDSKMDVEDESWKTDLEKRLALPTPSPEVGRPAYTPCEETRTSPVIASARYDRDLLLVPNRTVYDNDKSDPTQLCLRMTPNQLNSTRRVQEDRELIISSRRYNEELRHGITPQIYTGQVPVQSVSPSYNTDQLRHGITPQCCLTDYATTIRLEAALNPSPPSSHPYYLLYNSYMDASYPHEQESPLDLSLHH